MSKETAAKRLAVFMDRYGFWGARHELELMLQAAAQEERQKVLAELRSEEAEVVYDEAWIGLVGTYPHLGVAFAEGKKALAIAKQEGKDEAEAALLEKWRAEDVEEWLRGWCEHPKDHDYEVIRFMCVHCRCEAIARARARAQGAAKEHEKIMADRRSTDSTIRRQAHTTTCAVHGSRACDCGAMP